jgi:hypothetical protein
MLEHLEHYRGTESFGGACLSGIKWAQYAAGKSYYLNAFKRELEANLDGYVSAYGVFLATLAASIAKGRFALDPLGLCVDIREADFDVLGPIRHEAPAHHVQAALAGLRIIADHRERVSRRDVPTRRDIRCRPMRRDREDELDLAHI